MYHASRGGGRPRGGGSFSSSPDGFRGNRGDRRGYGGGFGDDRHDRSRSFQRGDRRGGRGGGGSGYELASSSYRSYGQDDYRRDDREEEVDHQKERKQRRKAEKVAKKQARIDAHAKWVAERRRAREATENERAAKRERREWRQLSGQTSSTNNSPRAGKKAAITTDHRPLQLEKRKREPPSPPKGKLQTEPTVPPAVARSQRKRKIARGEVVEESDNAGSGGSLSGSFSSSLLLEEGEEEEEEEEVEETEDESESTADGVLSGATSPHASSSLTKATSAHTDLTVPVPAAVSEVTRRCVNKLTMSNVVELTREVSALFEGGAAVSATAGSRSSASKEAGPPLVVSRAVVLQSLMEQIDRLCKVDTGPLTLTGTLPFAGLLRSLQLLHGSQVGAELVERLSFMLQGHLAAADENASGNVAMLLAQVYLLYGVDATLVVSLLRYLLDQSSHTAAAAASASAAVSPVALCAAASGLALMRTCGEKLLKEAPREMEQALQDARRSATRMGGAVGSARFQALVSVMTEIATGHSRKARRTVTEEDAPVEAMLTDLCAVLPGGGGGDSGSKASDRQQRQRTLRRVVQTAHTLSGLTWAQMTQPAKPPRWYVPGVMVAQETPEAPSVRGAARHRTEAESNDTDDTATESGLSTSDEEDEEDEQALRQQQIQQMRQEEKAIAGQRFNTEHKREIFKCAASATDDLECFTMLMHRDPSFTRFNDVCAVLLQCAYQEKTFNPYYVQVLERFCSAKSACKKTLQFALWDRFKSIRIEGVDVVGYYNLACVVSTLIEHGVFTLSLLRGLDLENTNKTIGLFARVLVLRLVLQLSPSRLTEVFFGGDGFHAHDVQTDTAAFRRCMKKFMESYFVDEAAARRWLPVFYDVVAAGTAFDPHAATTPSGGVAVGTREVVDTMTRRRLERNAMRTTSSLTAPSQAGISGIAVEQLTPEARLETFMRRLNVAYKALKQGIS